MPNNHSTAPAPSGKPVKPSEDFPLFPHTTKRWAKKINGKMHYFGKWDDPDGALREYEEFLEGKVQRKPRRASALTERPARPSADFPLFPHATGRWAKKIRGKLHYFGPWSDPDGALNNYLKQKDDLHAGRTPRPDSAETTAKQLANAYLHHKKALVDAGELSPRTWQS